MMNAPLTKHILILIVIKCFFFRIFLYSIHFWHVAHYEICIFYYYSNFENFAVIFPRNLLVLLNIIVSDVSVSRLSGSRYLVL